MCNDNILINTDFTHPVNQHGQMEYTGYGYTIDMWQSEGPTVKIEDGCIAISGEGSVVQKTELYLIKSLLGKTVTLSIMTDDYIIHTVTFDMPTTTGTNTFASPSIYFEGVTAQIVLFWDQQVYQTCRFTLGPNATIRLKKIKLERGTVSTLKNEVVNYAEQLHKCQRYYQKGRACVAVNSKTNYDGDNIFTSYVNLGNMRIQPTVMLSNIWVPGYYDTTLIDQSKFRVQPYITQDSTGFYVTVLKQDTFDNILGQCLVLDYEANAEL